MANRIVRSIRAIRDINKQPLFTNEQNDLLSDTNDDVYVRLARRYERITGLPKLENKFRMHLKDYNQFKDDTQNMLIYLNNENERQDKMIDKLNTDVDELNKKAKRLKDITDEHTEQLKSLTDDLNEFKTDVKNNREQVQAKLDELYSTLDTIQEKDKQDKLQSEIDELRKTIETMQSDIKDVQSIEDARNFYSVSSNLSENVAGKIDKIYFDVYCLDTSIETDFELQIQKMDIDGNWDRGTYINQENLSITPYNNNRYYSISYDISDLEKIVSFTLTNNGNVIHIRQVKLSDY
ncbi:MAG: hypothetical protein KH152_07185 [Finegoldia magna]|nr:hypothetical protein [Finegoldia magna]